MLANRHILKGRVKNMPLIRVREGESFEIAFRKFKKSCEKTGILSDLKKRQHFEKPSVAGKKKSAAARKRASKKGLPKKTFTQPV